MHSKLHRNIILSYLFGGLQNFNVSGAVWTVYLVSKGLSLPQVGIAEALYHFAGVTMEIPTGVIADLFGRKLSRVLGCAVRLLATLLLIRATSFPEFCIAFWLGGLSGTLESGAGEALLYDSLKQEGIQSYYQKISGRIASIANICEACALILGGVLADIHFIYLYFTAAVIQLMTLIAACFFTEPDIGRGEERSDSFLLQIKCSISLVKSHPLIRPIILADGICDTLSCILFFYGRNLLQQSGFTQTVSGLIYFGYFVANAAGSAFVYKMDRRFGPLPTIMLLMFMFVTGWAGVSWGTSQMMIISYLLAGFAVGSAFPLFSNYLNGSIPSVYRATILSFRSLVFSMMMIGIFPAAGWLAGHRGLPFTFRLLFLPGSLFLLIFGYFAGRMIRSSREKN